MKRIFRLFAVLASIIAVMTMLAVTAGAANYTTQADSLKDMGLFLGTDKGYELDKTSTRAEAAVMLIRLLGKEAEAKAGTYTYFFKDVPTWADKYVGYMYANGLTQGTSATTFGSSESCTSKMYTVFVLRALGYTEKNGDFTYSGAEDFAESIGLYSNSDSATGGFLRDDMVAISYSALFQAPKGKNNSTLLSQLASVNAVSTEVADKYLDYYDAYVNCKKACSNIKMDENTEFYSCTNIDITSMDLTTRFIQSAVTSVVVKDNDITMKQESSIDYISGTANTTAYYSDGWLYTDSAQGTYKCKISNFNINQTVGIDDDIEPIYFMNSITQADTGNGMCYTIEYSADAMSDLLSTILSQYSDTLSNKNIEFKSLKIAMYFDKTGKLISTESTGDICIEQIISGKTVKMEISIESSMTVVNTGDSVTVTLPADLDGYGVLKTIS